MECMVYGGRTLHEQYMRSSLTVSVILEQPFRLTDRRTVNQHFDKRSEMNCEDICLRSGEY